MNVEQANAIPLSEILQKMDLQPVKSNSLDMWYYTPFREEKTPSFHINAVKNIWFDFGEDKGGKVIDFVCLYLARCEEDHTIADALRWLNNMVLKPSPLLLVPKEPVEDQPKLELIKVSALKEPELINYLEERGIPFGLACKYLKQAHVCNRATGREFYALCLRNEDNGYELRNKRFKGCLSSKNISFIRGAKVLPDEVHVFEGILDFLTALVYQKGHRFDGDAIILNSVSCVPKALPYIENYTYKTIFTWLDNDAGGEKATEAFNQFAKQQTDLSVMPMNNIYKPHKDVNAAHMKKLGL